MTKGQSLCHIHSQIASGNALGAGRDIRRRADADDLPARIAAPWAHVDQVIGVTDKVEIVFNHDDCGALGNKATFVPRHAIAKALAQPRIWSQRSMTSVPRPTPIYTKRRQGSQSPKNAAGYPSAEQISTSSLAEAVSTPTSIAIRSCFSMMNRLW